MHHQYSLVPLGGVVVEYRGLIPSTVSYTRLKKNELLFQCLAYFMFCHLCSWKLSLELFSKN